MPPLTLSHLDFVQWEIIILSTANNTVTADTRGSTAYNYSYNKRNRLAELAIASTVTADYTYDGLERLAIRTTSNMTPAGTTHYLYDRTGHLLVEADDTGQTLREYVWLDDMPLAVVSDVNTMSPNLYFVHADHLDTPVRMTDGSKAVVWDAYFLAFGTVASITGSASNNLRFPGQYFLIEDGLHYNWYRHYDPTIGRYLQPDPLGLEALLSDGPSVYAYVSLNPANYTDPTGQLKLTKRQIEAIFRACMFAWRLLTGNPEIKVPGPIPPPPISRPAPRIPKLEPPKEPPGGSPPPPPPKP